MNSAHIRQSRPDYGIGFQVVGNLKGTSGFAGGAIFGNFPHILCMIDSGLVGSTDFHSSHPQGHEPGTSLGGVPREQKMLKGHLPRVIYHQVY